MTNQPISNQLISLHETLYQFLMAYRENTKQLITFLFRPDGDKQALAEGRWFYDSPEKGWVNLFFTINPKHTKYYDNNIQFSVNIDGRWNIRIQENLHNFIPQALRNTISNIGKLLKDIYQPFEKNYKIGLPNALDLFFNFFSHANPSDDLKLIDENDFKNALANINTYRVARLKQISRVYLSGFSIKNYLGIKQINISDLPHKTSWIFLTGENGFGKTVLLRALAIGLYGDAEDIIIPRSKETTIEVIYHQEKKDDFALIIQNNTEFPLFFQAMPALAAYGPSRLQIQAQDSYKQQVKSSTATYNLFNSYGILKNIEAELLISYYDAPEKYAVLSNMLKALIPSLADIILDKASREILYSEKVISDSDSNQAEAISFEQLASGIKNIIAMVGDIYLRLSQAKENNYTDKPNKDLRNFQNPKDLFGIVIIDEIELHLHPKWQKELPTLLSSVFPNVQFIASTHSPIPLLGAPENSVFLKVNRTKEDGITLERLESIEQEMPNLLPNLILSSPIFGLTDIYPKNHNAKTGRIRTEDSYQDKTENDETQKRINDFFASKENQDKIKNLFKK
jgi:predicted ATP-binding protein involved in virulence